MFKFLYYLTFKKCSTNRLFTHLIIAFSMMLFLGCTNQLRKIEELPLGTRKADAIIKLGDPDELKDNSLGREWIYYIDKKSKITGQKIRYYYTLLFQDGMLTKKSYTRDPNEIEVKELYPARLK